MLIEQIVDIQSDFCILKSRKVIKPVAQHHIRHGIGRNGEAVGIIPLSFAVITHTAADSQTTERRS